ncbi:MAG: alpha-amylase family glycosyl hydrolase [Flavobacteriales bacterium]|jgi:glycosidase
MPRISFLLLTLFLISSCKPDVVVDPPAEQPDGNDFYGTPFQGIPATEDIIMYEVNLRAFSSQGNLQGVIDKLDHLQSLHVNVIWLMPIYPIGTINSVNSPYSVKDHKAVSAEYGDLAKLRQLTDAAHARGMAVILDWVANHTAWDHPWMNTPSWYSQDANGNVIMPPGTNWADVADLNFENHDMRNAMVDAMKYWVLQANVDGFRCDYANGVPFDFWLDAITALRSLPGRELIMLAEGDRVDHYAAGFDMTFSWDYYTALKNVFAGQPAFTINAISGNEYLQVPAGKQKLRFTTNHDQSAWEAAPPSLFGGIAGATAATVAMTFMQGVPLIYTGQETGRTTTTPFFSNSPIDWNANLAMVNDYRSIYSIYAASDAARRGTSTLYSANDAIIVERVFNGEHLLVIVNARNSAVTVPMPAALVNTAWTEAQTGATEFISDNMGLMPYGYKVLRYVE